MEMINLLARSGSFLNVGCATNGHTPLVQALWHKQTAAVETLLGLGASASISTHWGQPTDGYIEAGNSKKDTALFKRMTRFY